MAAKQRIAAKGRQADRRTLAEKSIRHAKFHCFLASNALEVNGLTTKLRKNGKSENAERSEPNLGKLPGSRANPALLESRNFRQRPPAWRFPAKRFFRQLESLKRNRLRVGVKCVAEMSQAGFVAKKTRNVETNLTNC